jgi:AcrR family transcriptional regulator
MIDEKQKILNGSTDIFLKEGFYKTPMDEIARRLRISKKTIYKYFDSKESLVNEVVHFFLLQNKTIIQGILESDINAVTKAFNLFQHLGVLLLKVSNKWLEDIQLHYKHLWKQIDEFRTRMLLANTSKLIDQGKAEGFIVDYPTEIIVMFFVSSIRGIINPNFIIQQKLDANSIFNPTINLLMNAILTDKGKELFNTLKPGVNK